MTTEMRPFLCDSIDKSLLRSEWEKWLRSFTLYLQSEDIKDAVKQKSKLLHLGGPQLQEVIFNTPGALVEADAENKVDVFKVLVEKLNNYFTPKRNSTFERHLFRSIAPLEGEPFNKFLLRLRHQSSKCCFGETKSEIEDIALKDKIIDSWASVDLRKRLLEKEQSLNEIIETCQINEQIQRQSQSMISKQDSEVVNKVYSTMQKGRRGGGECSRCGQLGHVSFDTNCPAKKSKCNKCGLAGHYARKCKTKGLKRKHEEAGSGTSKQRKFQPSKVRCIGKLEDDFSDNSGEYDCLQVETSTLMNEFIKCNIGGHEVTMIIDSGSRFNLLSQQAWDELESSKAVRWNIRTETVNQFKAYAANQLLEVLYVFEAPVGVRKQSEKIATFYVIKDGKQSLLGRYTAIQLKVLQLGLGVNNVEMMQPFPKISNVKIKLSLDPAIKPVKQPVRRIPIALERKVEDKLNEALAKDIIEPVTGPCGWVSPIVAVFKEGGEIRLCVDMRRANQAVLRENYPLPTFDSIMTKLKEAKFFSRLDLKWAYHQLELEESSREITTFITHKGLFRYKRLMFGISSAPEIFQRVLEELLSTCRNCLNYIDDVIIYGSTKEEHDSCVKTVLEVCRNNNILLNHEKCVWGVTKLKFLGHILSDAGILPDPDKIKTILDFRAPQTKEETRSFLGLVTYVSKFIPDVADITDPLRSLLKLNSKFEWGAPQQKGFEKLKQLLSTIPSLAYFNQQNRTRVIADASPVALGAVLIQFDSNNEVHIISFASKSLSDVEKRYSQTEKESLALVWAVERFYFYLIGLEFELVTDHKPLEAIFKPMSKPPARIERWLLRLQSYKFKVIYRPGKENIADSISRLCKIENTKCFDANGEQSIFHIVSCSIPSAVTITEISGKSSREKEITDAIEFVKSDSWPRDGQNKYYPFRHELSTVGDIILRGTRIVIPTLLRKKILDLAHEGHPGESAMKRRVRAKVWWPLIDRDVEAYVKSCRDCLIVSRPNNPAPMQRHTFPNGPWQCVSTDLLGPLPNNEYVLVLIDYYSRYQEIKFLRSITSEAIIKVFNEIFCRLGIPKSIRADNGRQFVSNEFREYCKDNGITLITTPPYWPQANGEVENMNKSLVKRLKIAHANKTNYKEAIQKFILMYNVTPHSTTGTAPTELMYNRVIRDKIPGIHDITDDMLDSAARDLDIMNKQKGKEKGDMARKAKPSDIAPGDKVLLRNVVFSHKLTPTFDPTEYEVLDRDGNEVTVMGNGKRVRRNISHVKKLPYCTSHNPDDVTTTFENTVPSTAPGTSLHSAAPTSPSSKNTSSGTPNHLATHRPGIDAPAEESKLRLKLYKEGGMWRPVNESGV